MSIEDKKKHDVSIEEILKSIRGVIDSHNKIDKSAEIDDILELTNIVESNSSSIKEKDSTDKLISAESAAETVISLKNLTNKAQAVKDEAKYKSLTIEELVIQILKPELKEWLDKNLPRVVKLLVEKEIKRLISEDEKAQNN